MPDQPPQAQPLHAAPATPEPEPIIEVNDLVRAFGPQGHLIGTETPTSGSVKVFGKEITTMNDHEMQELRLRYGMLFQSGALLQSLTVAENVALPLVEHAKLDSGLIDTVVKMKLEQVGLTGHGHKKPSQISGGMRKRVALARALVLDPPLLFSDEPTAGLDPIMTAVVDELTQKLTQKIGATAVIVTHDMNSVFRIANRIIMLGTGDRQGHIVAEGSPEEISANPDPIVRQFIHGEAGGAGGDISAADLYQNVLLDEA